jgi:hypothetical protein
MKTAAVDLRWWLSLAAAVLAALILLYWLLLAGERALPEAVMPDAAALASQNVDHPEADADIVAAIVERPLFLPDRRPVEEEPPEPTEAAQPRTDIFANVRLLGVVGSAGGVAIIGRPAGVVRVSRGEQLDGWTLDAIHVRIVRFTRAGDSARELQLLYPHERAAGVTGVTIAPP